MITTLNTCLGDLLHLFFPHYCEGCGSDAVEHDQLLCLQCVLKLPATGFFETPGNPVEKTFYGRMHIASGGAAFYFTKDSLVQHLITALKYRNNKQVGGYLGRMTAQQMLRSGRFTSIDAIIPLPLNRKKLQKRGYNQAALIAEGISKVLGVPVIPNAVIRKLNTETQTGKDRVSRWQSMQQVFEVAQTDRVEGKHVLLVDDIVTTGATLEACGNELLKVPGLTLSIAAVAWTI